MTYKNLPQHDLTAQLFLKFLLVTQYEVQRQKSRMSEKRMADVQISRAVVVSCRLVNPILVILHTVKFAEALRQEAHGSYRSIRQSYQKKKTLKLLCVQLFFVKMRHRLYKNRISADYVHKCEHMKACQIRRGAKFGKKHMAATGV